MVDRAVGKSLLQDRNYLALLSGQAISRTGDAVFWAGVLWLTYRTTGSSLLAGGVLAFYYLPAALFGLLGGALADRLDRRRILIVADVLRALLLVVAGAGLQMGGFNLPVLYALSFLLSALAKFFDPALSAFIPDLVGPRQLTPANSVSRLCNQVADIAGPVLGGILVGRLGGPAVLYADAGSFLLAACLTATIRAPARVADSGGRVTPRSLYADIVEGLRLLGRSRVLLQFAVAITVVNFMFGAINVAFPRYAVEALRLDSVHYGLLGSALAGGAVVGSVLTPALSRVAPPLVLVYGGLCGVGAGLVVLGAAHTFGQALVLLVLVGCFMLCSQIPTAVILQQRAPASGRGRVFGTLEFGRSTLMPVSAALTGAALEVVTPGVVFYGCGALLTGLAIYFWRATARAERAGSASERAATPG